MPKQRKVKFYSANDMSSGYYLRIAESVFQNWDEHCQSADINILLELHNIKKYIDADLRLNQWSDDQFKAYKELCARIPKILGIFYSSISDSNINEIYRSTDIEYKDDFWQLLCSYKTYKNISETVFEQLIKNNANTVWEILYHKELVKKFGRVIASQLLKQYRLYCEDGVVNRELLEMSSEHIVFSSLPGMLDKKYAYANSSELRREMFLLFSDQSMMSYTEKTKSKYKTLPQLLISEKMMKEDFAEYQQQDLDWLIKRSSIFLLEDGSFSINKERVYILKDLFSHEVICPIYYNQKLQKQVNFLKEKEDIKYERSLFSKPEQDYLNYILNKAEFSNGLDLRNRYSHDTCSLDEKTQNQDYLELLEIMVLVIIKINEEFCKIIKLVPSPTVSDTDIPSGPTVEIITKHGETVNVRVGNGTEYENIREVGSGEVLEYIATAGNGWNAVKVGTQVGWVSGEYSKETNS